MMEHIWPKEFGQTLFPKIKEYLRKMISGSKQQWNESYQKMVPFTCGDAQAMEKLNEIYSRPEYYAGWWLREQEGNLEVQGSVSAEQNHASIVSNFGKGANWDISFHLCQLLKRHIKTTKERREKEAEYKYKTRIHKSGFNDDVGIDNDHAAKETLSRYAYNNFVVEYKQSYQWRVEKYVTNGVVVCPIVSHGNDQEESVTVPTDGRCSCRRRVSYMWQC